jgi:hypothetical protein
VCFACCDMRGYIVWHKKDYGASHRLYGVLQWRSRLNINICDILGVGRFSTFATISALAGHGSMSDLSPLSEAKRKSDFGAVRSVFDPQRTS